MSLLSFCRVPLHTHNTYEYHACHHSIPRRRQKKRGLLQRLGTEARPTFANYADLFYDTYLVARFVFLASMELLSGFIFGTISRTIFRTTLRTISNWVHHHPRFRDFRPSSGHLQPKSRRNSTRWYKKNEATHTY